MSGSSGSHASSSASGGSGEDVRVDQTSSSSTAASRSAPGPAAIHTEQSQPAPAPAPASKVQSRVSLSSAGSGSGSGGRRASQRGSSSPTSPADPPRLPEHSGSSSLPYSQEEIERVRQALAAAGYPAPNSQDIERVFQHVRAELVRQQHEVDAQPRELSQRESSGYAHPDAARYRSSTSAGLSSPSPPHTQRQPPQRAPQQQPWDASVPTGAPRYHGPRGSVDRSEPYRRAHAGGAEASGARVADVPVYYRRGPHAAAAAPADPRHPALYLNPAVRLERYMRRYEHDLAAYYHDGAAGVQGDEEDAFLPAEAPQAAWGHVQETAHSAWSPAVYEAGDRASGFQASHVLSAPLAESRGIDGATARPVDAATLRRSANTVFNMTGDERYRYRPPMPKPRSAAPSYADPSRRAHQSRAADDHAVISSTVPMADTCFNAQRPARRPHASRLLSTYTVGHLQPDGSTLRVKADPVKRGHQMRELWERDPFLSQRGWNAERWLTRQATMNYDEA